MPNRKTHTPPSQIIPNKKCLQNNFLLKYVVVTYITHSHALLPYTCKGKAIPLQALAGPEGSRRLRFPDIKTIGT
jgi:hypothetical protein